MDLFVKKSYNVSSLYILGHNLGSIGISSLKVWWNSVLNQSDPGSFLVDRHLITASFPLGIIGLFKCLPNLDSTFISDICQQIYPCLISFLITYTTDF